MKVCIFGSRDFNDYNIVCEAINKSGFKITEVVSGCAQGADKLGEKWANDHGVPITKFPAEWDDLTQPGAVIKTNRWNKKYNANAGFYRNAEMAKYCDAAIGINMGTNGTANMINAVKDLGKPIYEYKFDTHADQENFNYTF